MHSFNLTRAPRGTRPERQYSSSFNPQYVRKAEATPAQLLSGVGDKILTIPVPTGSSSSKPVLIQDVREIASYSWADAKNPTIIVPGSPPVWLERPLPYLVPRDLGTVFVDQNAGRLSTSPLLPLIAAVAHHDPSFSLASVDFVTDRNGLRKLWRWASDGDRGNFKIDVELVGKRTILMERWEPATTQQGGPGYERGFEKASTKPAKECEGATGHHRIVTYDLDGLKMLVRFKADATLPIAEQAANDQDPLDSLTSELEGLSVTKPHNTAEVRIPTFGDAFLTIVPGGVLVSQSSLVELKTRSSKFVDNSVWGEAYAQMLLSQTPHIFLCLHERGEFQQVRKRTLQELETEGVAGKTHERLRSLRKVLGEIRDIVVGEGEGTRLSLVCLGEEILVYESKKTDRCLPPAILKKFN